MGAEQPRVAPPLHCHPVPTHDGLGSAVQCVLQSSPGGQLRPHPCWLCFPCPRLLPSHRFSWECSLRKSLGQESLSQVLQLDRPQIRRDRSCERATVPVASGEGHASSPWPSFHLSWRLWHGNLSPGLLGSSNVSREARDSDFCGKYASFKC